jgi:carboxylesterase
MSTREIPFLMRSAEPFFFPGDRIGCLMVHGFTGTPREMRSLGQHLSSSGHTVLGIRLPGHATQPEDMIRGRWQDWFASLEDGWHLLASCADQIFVVGLSLGGILALQFSASFPVAGAVAMATPHHLPKDWRIPIIKPLSRIMRFRQKGPSDWFDLVAYGEHTTYSVEPVRALAELRDVIREMQLVLPKVKVPVLLIYSSKDRTVKPEDGHAERIYSALGSQEKQLFWVDNCRHVITLDAGKEMVFQAVSSFVNQYSREQNLRP